MTTKKKTSSVMNNAQLSKELRDLKELIVAKGVVDNGCSCEKPVVKFKGELIKGKYEGDAGLDLVSQNTYDIGVLKSKVFKTGCYVEIPEGYVGLVKGRSSLGMKGQLFFNGVIDSGYRGEVLVSIFNTGNCFSKIKKGDRIAQLVIVKCLTDTEIVESLSESDRGNNAFGSSNKGKDK